MENVTVGERVAALVAKLDAHTRDAGEDRAHIIQEIRYLRERLEKLEDRVGKQEQWQTGRQSEMKQLHFGFNILMALGGIAIALYEAVFRR